VTLEGSIARPAAGVPARVAPEGALVVTRPAKVVPIAQAARCLGDAAAIVWDAGAGFAFAGAGVVARVDGRGDERFAEVGARVERLFSGVSEVRAAGADDAPPLRVFGGFAFAPSAARAAPWAAFGDASFTLPRVTYASDGARAFVRVAAQRAPSTRADALLDEASAIAATIAQGGHVDARSSRGGGEIVVDRAAYLALAAELVAAIRRGELAKAALSLHARASLGAPFDLPTVIARLGAAYPDCARFAFEREGRAFVGASPERLVVASGARVEVDALAGSIARDASPEVDRARAAELAADAKERAEHALVVDAIRDALVRVCDDVTVPTTPRVRTLANVHHLHTPVTASRRLGTHVLDIVEALHPTPAVGGSPRGAALAWLAERERHERGWYTGGVGWLDAAGDGAFSVGIRAALCARDEADLYAGAGVVAASVPERELAEVELKLRPMLAALGVVR
jgi:menaquinone-specific isochorismate synthase